LFNRITLNPACFKAKQRPELGFPRAKVAGSWKSVILVAVKNLKITATTRASGSPACEGAERTCLQIGIGFFANGGDSDFVATG